MLRTLHRNLLKRFPRHERLFTAAVEISGQMFLTPKMNGSMCNVSEPWMVELLARVLRARPGVFCDCGVNIGQTLLAVKAADLTRRYIGFEPNAECVAYVEKLVAINQLSDVMIVPVGLSNEGGLRKLQLYHGTTCDPSASVVEDFRPAQAVDAIKLVPVMRFADVEQVVSLPDLGFVKIDVEGAEAEVIASMRAALARFQPWLIVEILPCYTASNTARVSRQGQIEDMMRDAGYAILRILKTPAGSLAGLTELAEIGVHDRLDFSDYVFCPRGDLHLLRQAVNILEGPAS